MNEQLEQLQRDALAALEQAADASALEQWRTTHLGRRSRLSELLGGLGKLPPEERASVGQAANRVKKVLEEAFAGREATIRERELVAALERDRLDVTLPGRPAGVGALHPISQTINECVHILKSMGF